MRFVMFAAAAALIVAACDAITGAQLDVRFAPAPSNHAVADAGIAAR